MFVESGVERIERIARTASVLTLLAAVFLAPVPAVAARTIVCGEAGPYHLQGAASDGSSIYWCYTTKLVKTDLEGNVLASVAVPMHSGDLTVHRGEVYVATEDRSRTPSANEVRVYDAATLAFKRKYGLDGILKAEGRDHYASNIAYANGCLWLAAGTDDKCTSVSNYVYKFTPSFDFEGLYAMNTGNSQYGVQTIEWTGEQWILGVYGGIAEPKVAGGALNVSADFTSFESCSLGASEGVFMLNGELWTAVSAKQDDGSYVATATCRAGALPYAACADGAAAPSPADLVAGYGFAPRALYRAGADAVVSVPPAAEDALVLNTCVRGGAQFALDLAAGAIGHGVALASGRLVVPDPAVFAPSDEPIVLSQSTLAFTGSGELRRDIVIRPTAGYESAGSVIDVAEGQEVVLRGHIGGENDLGNLVKRGVGTLTIATSGSGVTNRLGSGGAGVTGENHYASGLSTVVQFPENGDGPSPVSAPFMLTDGTVKIATDPGVTTLIGGADSAIGCRTTKDGVETTGHFELHSGNVAAESWLALGYLNGSTVTAPGGPLVPTLDVYGGVFTTPMLDVGYCGYDDAVTYTTEPVVRVHPGGTLRVTERIRLDMAQSRGTFVVDGGLLEAAEFRNAYYFGGSRVDITVTNGGTFRVTGPADLASKSSDVLPSYARVTVVDGTLEARSLPAAASADVAFHFDGGTFRSRFAASGDGSPAGAPTTVGDGGMTIDLSGASYFYFGYSWRGPITGAPGATAPFLRVEDAVHYNYVQFGDALDLAGGIVVSNAQAMLGGNVTGGITFQGYEAGYRALADVTVDRMVFDNHRGRIDVTFDGFSDTATKSRVTTVHDFTPPRGGYIVAQFWNDSGTTTIMPTGEWPFLRVPVSSPLHASYFVNGQGCGNPCTVYNAGYKTVQKYHEFYETEANGWRTICVRVSESALPAATLVDPRMEDWTTPGVGTWKIGPWLFDCAGVTTCANPFADEKQKWESGGLKVDDALVLTGGGIVKRGTFAKMGTGTLTFAGDSRWEFGSEYVPNQSAAANFPAAWNLFDEDGNSATSMIDVVAVAAGTLQIGTGSDNPVLCLSSSAHLTVGLGSTSAPGAEEDACLRLVSGEIYTVGATSELRVGYNHGTVETAAHSPLLADFVMDGGQLILPAVRVGGFGTLGVVQTNSFILNGGTCEVSKNFYVGTGGACASQETCARVVVNGGRLEVGREHYGTTSEGRFIISQSGGSITNSTSVFEMNGGYAKLWNGFTAWNAHDADHRSQVWLNGGTIEFGNSAFNGGTQSELHWNGTVLKPFRDAYAVGASISGLFKYFNAREILAGGAKVDLSACNADYMLIDQVFTGAGDFTLTGDYRAALRLTATPTFTGDFFVRDGGIVQPWGAQLANHKVVLGNGGGVASYYSNAPGTVWFGENDTDETYCYGYGFAGATGLTISKGCRVKGTVYAAFRCPSAPLCLRVPKGTWTLISAPKGSFEGVDVPNQFKLHPALAALLAERNGTVSFALDTSGTSADAVKITISHDVNDYVPEAQFTQHTYPDVSRIVEPPSWSSMVYVRPDTAGESRLNAGIHAAKGDAGTLCVEAPLAGAKGGIFMQYGRIEGRPEYFNDTLLDLNGTSVRFTESGTVNNLQITNRWTSMGVGLEVAEGKTVHMYGEIWALDGASNEQTRILKMDPGRLVLHGDPNRTLRYLANTDSGQDNDGFTLNPNGNVPYGPALGVVSGTLALDLPGTSVVHNAKSSGSGNIYAGYHHIPDGKGGAWPAVLEWWQGTLQMKRNDCFVIGRHAGLNCDDYAAKGYTKRPYMGFDLYGGKVEVDGVIMGYNNYKFKNCALYALNVYGGELAVGTLRFAINHDPSSVMIDGLETEAVVNVYGGRITKANGTSGVCVGGFYDNATATYGARGTVNVYGGSFEVADYVDVPHNARGKGIVNLKGGVLEAKNFAHKGSRAATTANERSELHFDGGAFRPTTTDQLYTFTVLDVGAAGGWIDLPAGVTYTIAQNLARAEELGAAADGGFGASGAGTLVLNASNDFTGPVRVKDSATVVQGVPGAFSDSAELAGGTLDLNNVYTTFATVSGRGTIRGSCEVTGAVTPGVSATAGDVLTVQGDLVLGSGATLALRVADDASAADGLVVTGRLEVGAGLTVDLGRYDDEMLDALYKVKIVEADTLVYNGATLVRSASGKLLASVVQGGNALYVQTVKRGCAFILR